MTYQEHVEEQDLFDAIDFLEGTHGIDLSGELRRDGVKIFSTDTTIINVRGHSVFDAYHRANDAIQNIH